MKRAHLHLSAFVTVDDEAFAGHLAKKLREAAERIVEGYYHENLTVGAECEEESPGRVFRREEWMRAHETAARRG